jgi:hypothetical protein
MSCQRCIRILRKHDLLSDADSYILTNSQKNELKDKFFSIESNNPEYEVIKSCIRIIAAENKCDDYTIMFPGEIEQIIPFLDADTMQALGKTNIKMKDMISSQYNKEMLRKKALTELKEHLDNADVNIDYVQDYEKTGTIEDLNYIDSLVYNDSDASEISLTKIPIGMKYLKNLTTISIPNSKIRKIENIPDSLTVLILNNSEISKIENIPKSVNMLELGNRINKIENLPDSLYHLQLDNGINKIENLPQKLGYLNLSNNKNITKIEPGSIPDSVVEFVLSNTRISKIENLPESLKYLTIENTNIPPEEIESFKKNNPNISVTH